MEPAAFRVCERNAGVIHTLVLLEPNTYLLTHIETNTYIETTLDNGTYTYEAMGLCTRQGNKILKHKSLPVKPVLRVQDLQTE